MDLLSLSVFALALFIAAGSPGPSIAALVARVLSRGWRDVLPFVAAMWVGEVIWLSMALTGLTTLAQTFQAGFAVLKWAGVAYLVWMAVQMWRAPADTAGKELPKKGSALSMFGAGLALTMGNPKIMVFYLALLPSLIELPVAGFSAAASLAAVAVVVLAVADGLWMLMAHRGRAFLKTPRAVRLSNRLSAAVMGGAAAAIAAKA